MARKPFKTFTSNDAVNLKKLVKMFNAKITEVSKTPTLKNAQPERIKYSDIVKNITSRKELNRITQVYGRYLKRGAERIYTNDSGVRLTRWARNEAQYAVQRINRVREAKRKQFESLPGGIRKSAFDELGLTQKKNFITKTTTKQYAQKVLRGLIRQSGVDYYEVGEERYKANYLKSLRENYTGVPGFSKLYKKIQGLSGRTLLEALAQDPTFEIRYNYGFEEATLRVEYLTEQWEDYINDREYFDEE